jgi:hypothetical protein
MFAVNVVAIALAACGADKSADAPASPSPAIVQPGPTPEPAVITPVSSAEQLSLYVESGIHHSARAVAFSHNGSLLATGSLDRNIKVWDVRTSRELLSLANGKMATALAFLPSRPIIISSNEDGTLSVWDYRRQEHVTTLQCGLSSPSIAVSASGDVLMCADANERVIKRWSTARFEPMESIGAAPPIEFVNWQFTQDGTLAVHSNSEGMHQIRDATTFALVGTLEDLAPHSRVESAVYAPRARTLAIAHEGAGLRVWHWAPGDGRAIEQPTGTKSSVHSVALSSGERFLAYAREDGDVVVLNIRTLRETSRLKSRSNRIEHAGLDASRLRLNVQVWYDSRFRFDLRRGAGAYIGTPTSSDEPSTWRDSGRVNGLNLGVNHDGDSLRLLATGTDRRLNQLATVVLLDKEKGWVAVAPDGRFDTNMDLTDMRGAHWIEKGQSFAPLPLDLFMRDYYEPRLIPRLLSCTSDARSDPEACRKQFTTLPPLAALNRVRPTVKILGVRESPSGDEVLVDVEAHGATDPSQSNGRTTTLAYDLHLFRDGQLVGQRPAAAAGAYTTDRNDWKNASVVTTPIEPFRVQLPTAPTRPVVFQAYAFNEDRVKSETSTHTYRPPVRPPRRAPRAYVITIGVNEYQASGRRLNFAVNDAEKIAASLARIASHEVVPISLLSDAGEGRVSVNNATKANIRAVLRVLAGDTSVSPPAGIGATSLRRATPDDVVIVSFSGHGHTQPNGTFYMLPSDSGVDQAITPDTLAKSISSEELSDWMRDIDAGHMAMVVDACHAAASVDANGFKPGPMGDRGLGQLAYNKGMQILAASQADEVALEVAGLQHGLLTYALLEGLAGKRLADVSRNGVVTLQEWLEYGERRVPRLYDDVRSGRLQLVGRDGYFMRPVARAQAPTLFDFRRSARTIDIR